MLFNVVSHWGNLYDFVIVQLIYNTCKSVSCTVEQYIHTHNTHNTFMILMLIQLCEFIPTSLTMQTCFHSRGIRGMCTNPFLSPLLLYIEWVNKYSNNLSVNLDFTTQSWFWCWINYVNSSLLSSPCKHVFIGGEFGVCAPICFVSSTVLWLGQLG